MTTTLPAPMMCEYCEASSSRPGDNLHCVIDGSPHAWHICGDIRSEAADSDCPNQPNRRSE